MIESFTTVVNRQWPWAIDDDHIETISSDPAIAEIENIESFQSKAIHSDG